MRGSGRSGVRAEGSELGSVAVYQACDEVIGRLLRVVRDEGGLRQRGRLDDLLQHTIAVQRHR
eukprot:3263752-Rhodomonas_salina.2